jgi:uncharacterized C2H2 Zn-finger protein
VSPYQFQKVEWPDVKYVPCPDCGKTVRRKKTFWQTVNPLNKLPDGTVKDRRDILSELRVEADAWREVPEQCAKCLGGGS